MTQEALKELLDIVEAAIQSGDWKVDGACDPDLVIRRAKKALAQPERHELQARGEHPAPCARHCEANAFKVVIRNLKATLAQPKQEPVAMRWLAEMIMSDCGCSTNNERLLERVMDRIDQYERANTPPQEQQSCDKRTWVGLTDEEFDKLLGPFPRYAEEWSMTDFIRFARAIEAAHGIKEST